MTNNEVELKDEDLKNVTGGKNYYEDTIPSGAIIFNVLPDNMSMYNYVCSNILFNGSKTGENNGLCCACCDRKDWYRTNDGLVHGCCVRASGDFRKID